MHASEPSQPPRPRWSCALPRASTPIGLPPLPQALPRRKVPPGAVVEPGTAQPHIMYQGPMAFGSEALESLRRAGQMPPFPDTMPQERLVVQVPIAYRLME